MFRAIVAARQTGRGSSGASFRVAGRSLRARSRIRFSSFSHRLSSLSPIAPAQKPVPPDYAARLVGSARSEAPLQNIQQGTRGLDFQRAAPPAAARELAGDRLPRIAGSVRLPSHSGEIFGLSWAHLSRKAAGSRDRDREACRHPAADCGESRSGGSAVL